MKKVELKPTSCDVNKLWNYLTKLVFVLAGCEL